MLRDKILGHNDLIAVAALALVVWGLAIFGPVYSDAPKDKTRSLEQIRESGKLLVLTQNNPAIYYLDRDDRERGPEYALVKSFAKYLGVKPVFVVKNSIAELLDAVERGEGDMASAGLSITQDRRRRFQFGPVYNRVSQQVVCRRGGARPRSVADLLTLELAVIAGSSYEERLLSMQALYPDLTWQSTSGVSSELLLEKVRNREVDCTVMDSNIVAINQRYYPEIKVRFDIGGLDSLAWVLTKGENPRRLKRLADLWFSEFKNAGKLEDIHERYYGHVKLFDYVDTKAFISRIEKRYLTYREHFRAAAEAYGLSETLLAAQSYQESHWNPRARSPTGVRGIMMLTLPTAKAMGVKSRLNAEQNIRGGARYLAKLKALLSRQVAEPDLSWLALAAYNVGLGHLRDAQKLAREFGKDQYKWRDLKEVLPLLSDRRYYRKLKHGYARGTEPVRYVQQIREYEQILGAHLPPYEEETEDPVTTDSREELAQINK